MRCPCRQANVLRPRVVAQRHRAERSRLPLNFASIRSMLPAKSNSGESNEPTPSALANVTLVREQRSRVRDLAGFKKNHQVPGEVSEHTNSFVARIAADDLSGDLESRFADFRRLLKFKRVDMQVSDPEGGVGQISTPWFDYQVIATIAPDDPSEVLWRRQVAEFRSPKDLFSSPFSAVFGNLFDTVELLPPAAIDLSLFIDQIEERGIDTITLDYDRNVTWCHINLKGVQGQLQLTADRVALVVAQPQPPSRLLEAFFHARSQFGGNDRF